MLVIRPVPRGLSPVPGFPSNLHGSLAWAPPATVSRARSGPAPGQAPRPARHHRLNDPLQILNRAELDHDLPPALTDFYLDPCVERIRQLVRKLLQGRSDGPAARPLPGRARGFLAERNDLFDSSHRQALGHDPVCELLL